MYCYTKFGILSLWWSIWVYSADFFVTEAYDLTCEEPSILFTMILLCKTTPVSQLFFMVLILLHDLPHPRCHFLIMWLEAIQAKWIIGFLPFVVRSWTMKYFQHVLSLKPFSFTSFTMASFSSAFHLRRSVIVPSSLVQFFI